VHRSPSRDSPPGPYPWWLIPLTALVWLPAALRAGWTMDDRELLFENPVTSGALSWTAAFGRDYFHHLGDAGQWRPLASLSMRLARGLWGEWVTGYHLGNVALHVGVVGVAAQLLRGLGEARRKWIFGLACFALHPVLADSVVWISGRTSMLAALFPLAGMVLALALQRRGAATWIAGLVAGLGLFAGLLAKEEAILFALVLPLIAAARSPALARATALAVLAALFCWWLGRWAALGQAWPHASTPALGSAPLAERAVYGGCAIVEALRLGVLPSGYPPQYRPEFLLQRGAPLHPIVIAALGWSLWATALFGGFARARKNATLAVVAAPLVALSFLPYTQLLPIGEVFAPRFLYLPLLFAAPLVSALWERLPLGRAPLAIGLLLLSAAAWLSCERGGVYADLGAWRTEVLRHQPDDAPSWNGLGLHREEQGDLPGARDAWRRAILAKPDYSRPYSNLGRVQLELGEYEAAEESFRSALRAEPSNAIVHVNYGSLMLRAGQAAEAEQLYRRATELAPGLAPAWRGLGQARLEAGDEPGARTALEEARRLDPGDPATRRLLKRIGLDPP